jgi:hypothetical protein
MNAISAHSDGNIQAAIDNYSHGRACRSGNRARFSRQTNQFSRRQMFLPELHPIHSRSSAFAHDVQHLIRGIIHGFAGAAMAERTAIGNITKDGLRKLIREEW